MKVNPDTQTVFVRPEDLPVSMRARRGWSTVFLGVRGRKEGVTAGAVPESVINQIAEHEEANEPIAAGSV